MEDVMGDTSAIDAMLAAARADMDRVAPRDLATEVGAGALLVDIRPLEQRQRDGELPGALVIDRNVLEWRLDPTSAHRLPQVRGTDQRIIIVCDEGYSSSLAAATLRQLGLKAATDLVGGYQAWAKAPEAWAKAPEAWAKAPEAWAKAPEAPASREGG